MDVFLEIQNQQALMAFLTEAKKKGLLKDIQLNKVEDSLKRVAFPLRVPVKLDAVLGIAGNPIVRKTFGRKMEKTVLMYLKAVIESGR